MGAVPSDAAYAHDLQEVLSDAPGLETAYPGIGGGVDDKLGKLVTAVSQPVHDSGKLLDAVRSLRNEAKGNFRMSSISGDPDALSLARGQQGVADAMENLMGRHLQANGQGALADQWGQARATIAKTHNLEAALHGNDIVGADLAKQARKGVPFTGKLGLISRFANHFPDVSTRGVGGAGVSKLAVAAAEAGGLGSIALHSPDMALGSLAFTAAPYGARKFLTSGLGQRILATPQYGPGIVARGLGAVAARAGAVPLNQLFNGASP